MFAKGGCRGVYLRRRPEGGDKGVGWEFAIGRIGK